MKYVYFTPLEFAPNEANMNKIVILRYNLIDSFEPTCLTQISDFRNIEI